MHNLQAGIYRHYKGGYYLLLGVAEHTETGEKVAVYVSLTGAGLPGSRMRVRPLEGPEGWTTPVCQSSGRPRLVRFDYVGLEIPKPSPFDPGGSTKPGSGNW